MSKSNTNTNTITNTPCTLQDVIEFLRVNMSVEVQVKQVPYQCSMSQVVVRVKLNEELIAEGSDQFFND